MPRWPTPPAPSRTRRSFYWRPPRRPRSLSQCGSLRGANARPTHTEQMEPSTCDCRAPLTGENQTREEGAERNQIGGQRVLEKRSVLAAGKNNEHRECDQKTSNAGISVEGSFPQDAQCAQPPEGAVARLLIFTESSSSCESAFTRIQATSVSIAGLPHR